MYRSLPAQRRGGLFGLRRSHEILGDASRYHSRNGRQYLALGINYAEGQAHAKQQVVSPFSGAGANIDVAFLLAMCWCVALLCGVLASSGGLFFETHDTTTDVALTRGTCPIQL